MGWLKRWKQNRGRKIFRYWDGQKERSIDPLVAYRDLETHKTFAWDQHFEGAVNAGDWESQETTAQAVRDVFDVAPFDAGGLTIAECVALLADFWCYCMSAKKKYNPSPTSPEPTEPEPSNDSTTTPDSDSGSTSAESTTDAPSPCSTP